MTTNAHNLAAPLTKDLLAVAVDWMENVSDEQYQREPSQE